MAHLETVSLRAIKPNPHRRMETYPLIRKKLDELKQSIETVGFWEGVIVRPAGDGYECAFGHHRIAAAREHSGEDGEVTVIVRNDLDDAKMLQFMGRENGEDYNAEFMVMFETWEAAHDFLARAREQEPEALEIAGFLGWTRLDSRDARAGDININRTAEACNAAYQLLHGKILDQITKSPEELRADLAGQTVSAARELCRGLLDRLLTVDRRAAAEAKVAQHAGRPGPTPAQVRANKREAVSSFKTVASDTKRGEVSPKKVRGEIWSRHDIRVREKKLPDFGIAIRQVRKQIQSWHSDEFADKVKELCAVAQYVQDADERDEYRFAARDLRDVMDRCGRSADRFEKAANPANVAHLRKVEND